jgi:hypothetical protein
MNQEIERINRLTFRELRNELTKCNNDPVKEKIIRNLMLVRYKQHLERKRLRELKKIEYQQKQSEQTNDFFPFDDDDFAKPSFESLNELDDEKSNELLFSNRKIEEQDRDHVNNSIVERLNGDIDIKEMRNKKKKPNIVSPYTNFPGDNFAPFNSKQKVPKKDFSNMRPNVKPRK